MIFRDIRKFIQNEDAGTLTLTAIMFPLLLGFGGLGLDVTGWYMQKREVQNLVDMAAIDAVHSGDIFEDAALATKLNDFLTGKGLDADADVLSVNSPPTSGDYAGRNGFYEIELRREVPLHFLNAFYGMVDGDASAFVSSRAVAGTLIVGTQCIVALDESADRALEFSGNTTVASGCGLSSNSTSSESIYVGGSADLTEIGRAHV